MKRARTGMFTDEPWYDCKFDWPEDCFVQGGSTGLVLKGKGSFEKVVSSDNPLDAISDQLDDPETYFTAFFEAFPHNPDTFIRGEGETIEAAELSAWNQFQKFNDCKKHEFERRGYTNGGGFCKHCGMFSGKAFEPLEKCCICGKATYYTCDIEENWYCEEHAKDKPVEKYTSIDKMIATWFGKDDQA